MQQLGQPDGLGTLSTREREVLELLALDKVDRVIARELGIKERTVRAHVAQIILKLGVRSRVGAAVAFTEWRVRRYLAVPPWTKSQ